MKPDPLHNTLESVTLTDRDFTAASLRGGSYTDCRFVRCNFTEADLSKALFADCEFEGCDFSLVKVSQTRMRNAKFLQCKFAGVNFSTLDTLLIDIGFQDSLLRACVFSRLPLNHSRFTSCDVIDCDFTDTDLSHADFQNATLSGTVFIDCSLKAADFSGAAGYRIDPTRNSLKDAVFNVPDVLGLLEDFQIIIR